MMKGVGKTAMTFITNKGQDGDSSFVGVPDSFPLLKSSLEVYPCGWSFLGGSVVVNSPTM